MLPWEYRTLLFKVATPLVLEREDTPYMGELRMHI